MGTYSGTGVSRYLGPTNRKRRREVMSTFDIHSLWLSCQSLEVLITHFCQLHGIPVEGDDRVETSASGDDHSVSPTNVTELEVNSPPGQDETLFLLPPPPPAVSQQDIEAAINAALAPVLAELQRLSQSFETQSQAVEAIQQKADEEKKELSNSFLKINDNQVSYNAFLKGRLDTVRDTLRTLKCKAVIKTDLELAVVHQLLPVNERLNKLENASTAASTAHADDKPQLTALTTQLQTTSKIVDSMVKTIPVDATRLEKLEKDIQLLNVAMAGLPPRRPRTDDAKKGKDKKEKESRRPKEREESRRTRERARAEASTDKGKTPLAPKPSKKRTAAAASPLPTVARQPTSTAGGAGSSAAATASSAGPSAAKKQKSTPTSTSTSANPDAVISAEEATNIEKAIEMSLYHQEERDVPNLEWDLVPDNIQPAEFEDLLISHKNQPFERVDEGMTRELNEEWEILKCLFIKWYYVFSRLPQDEKIALAV